VVDEKLLESQGLSSVKGFAKYVPNLVFSQNAGQAILYIRGIGSSNASAGSDPSVTEQVDGVYIARPTAQFGDFMDVERVEVLRGARRDRESARGVVGKGGGQVGGREQGACASHEAARDRAARTGAHGTRDQIFIETGCSSEAAEAARRLLVDGRITLGPNADHTAVVGEVRWKELGAHALELAGVVRKNSSEFNRQLNGSGGVIPTNSPVIVPFGMVDQRPQRPRCDVPSHCGNGHVLTPENLKLSGGRWRCRRCGAERAARFMAAGLASACQPSSDV
jgi:hypothetical protein